MQTWFPVHRKCVSGRVLKNITGKVGGPEGVQGFTALQKRDQVPYLALPACLPRLAFADHCIACACACLSCCRVHLSMNACNAVIGTCVTQEAVRAAFERGSVHEPEAEEEEPPPAKVVVLSVVLAVSGVAHAVHCWPTC